MEVYANELGIKRTQLYNIYSGKTKKINSRITEKAIALQKKWQAMQRDSSETDALLTPQLKLFLNMIKLLPDEKKKQIWQTVNGHHSQSNYPF